MYNFDAFPEGAQALDTAESLQLPADAARILWEVLVNSGFMENYIAGIHAETYYNDKFIREMNLSSSTGSDITKSVSELLSIVNTLAEKSTHHPSIVGKVTTEDALKVIYSWISSNIMTISLDGIIEDVAHEAFGRRVSRSFTEAVLRYVRSSPTFVTVDLEDEIISFGLPLRQVDTFIAKLFEVLKPFVIKSESF